MIQQLKINLILVLTFSFLLFGFTECGSPDAQDTSNCAADINCDVIDQQVPDQSSNQDHSDQIDEQCHITMCLAGAIKQNSTGNIYLREICDREELKGLIPDCESGECFSAWDSFFPTTLYSESVYPGIF